MWIGKMASRGRAAIFWGIACFLFAQVGLTIAIERWRPEWSDPEYGYRYRNLNDRLNKEPNRPLLVVLGSSRIGNGFNADCLPPPSWKGKISPLVFNMSLAGGTPLYELLLLKRLLTTGIRPRWIVIEILPPWLNWEDKILASRDPVPPNRLRWSDLEILDRYAPGTRSHRHREWLKTFIVPWYSNRYCLISRYAPSWLEPGKTFQVQFWRHNLTPNGWLPFPLPTVSREQYDKGFGVARDCYAPKLMNFRVSEQVDLLLREILEICRQENIGILGLLRMPEGSDFRTLYSSEASRTIDSYLMKLCGDFNIDFIDASTWLTDDCFADGHHLLPKGAERFSLRFWNEVLEPRLQKECD
jgi:hypothetical protein